MSYFILLIVLFFGLAVGSFLNVVIFRLGTEEKIVNSRSKCLFCNHQLAWRDLLPLVSFMFLRGKCRYCKKNISWQYPMVEAASAIVFITLFAQVFHYFDILDLLENNVFTPGNFLSYFSLLFIFCALIVIFVFDLRDYIIPDEVIFPAIVVAFLWKAGEMFAVSGAVSFAALTGILMPAFLAGGFFLFLVLVTKGEGMGGGDVKLGFLMGLVLGFLNLLLALFVAFVSGAVVGMLLIASKKKKMKSMIPFGPFLIFGFLLSYFYGNAIIGWYWSMFMF